MKNILIAPCLAFLSIIFLSSCKQELSRDEAKDDIIKKDGYPTPIFYEFNKVYLKDFYSEGAGATANIGANFNEVKSMIDFFQSRGLVNVRDTTIREESTAFLLGTTIRTWVYAKIDITANGKKYLDNATKQAYKVRLWVKDFDQITGIRQVDEQKMAEVNYQIKNASVTPFGEFFSDKSKIESRSTLFSLYDDGWRIN